MANFELLTRLWQLGSVVAKTSAACLESAFGKGCCGFANFASKTVFPSKTSKSCGCRSIGMDGRVASHRVGDGSVCMELEQKAALPLLPTGRADSLTVSWEAPPWGRGCMGQH